MIRLLTPSRLGRVSTAVAILTVVGVVAAAWAYFSSSGSGAASANVGRLLAPTVGSATAGPGTVTLSWDRLDPPAGAAAISYYVSRGSDGSGSIGTCPTSTAPTTVTSCTDTALSAGSYAYTVTAVWQSWSSRSEAKQVVVASGAPAHIDIVSGSEQSPTVDAAFANPLVAKVTDSDGLPVSGVSVTFTVPGTGASAAFDSSGCTGATATACTVSTDSEGHATSARLTANTISGAYSISATEADLGDSATFTEANSPGPAASVSPIAGSNQSATVHTAFTSQLVARVFDQYGNPVPGADVTFAAPTIGARATFAADGCASNAPTTSCEVTTAADGTASSSALTAGTVAGTYPVTVATGSVAPTSFGLTNRPGPAASVTVSAGSPQSATVGADFASPFVALVTDAYANPLPDQTVTFTAPSSGPSGAFPGGEQTASANTDADGKAVSPAFTANTAAGGPYAVVATVDGLASGQL